MIRKIYDSAAEQLRDFYWRLDGADKIAIALVAGMALATGGYIAKSTYEENQAKHTIAATTSLENLQSACRGTNMYFDATDLAKMTEYDTSINIRLCNEKRAELDKQNSASQAKQHRESVIDGIVQSK